MIFYIHGQIRRRLRVAFFRFGHKHLLSIQCMWLW
jgi:hypothetical protein